MKILLGDIWTRRERTTKRLTLWISEEVLVSDIDGTTENYLRMKARLGYRATVKKRFHNQDIMPDTGANFRYARKDDKFWYDYDRLPTWLTKNLGTKEDVIAYHANIPTMERQDDLDTEIDRVLEEYTSYLPAYGEIDEYRAKNLAKACAVIQFGAEKMRTVAADRDDSFYRDLAAIIEKRDLAYLPKHYRNVKKKVADVILGVDVRKVIRLPRAGNQHAKKEISDRIKAWLILLRNRGANLSNEHIARKVRKMAPLVGLEAPSKRWMTGFLSEYHVKFQTGAGRYGGSRKGSVHTPYIPIEGALHPGDCWQMDGTRFNIVPHASFDGQQRSMTITVVRDVHSGELIGYHFDTKEDSWGYIHALEMAVKAKGHVPYELVHDKFPGHNTPHWERIANRIKHLGTKVTITSKATAKARAERGFGTLQDVFMIESKYYYGHGIQSTRDWAHRSPEYLNKVKREAKQEGFDFMKAAAEGARVVIAHNTTKYSEYSRVRAKVDQSPAELYAATDAVWSYKVDDFQRVGIFGIEKSATIQNMGLIKIQIQHVNYYYQLEDYEVISNYKKVRVCIDLEDLTTVYLFENSDDANRKFLGTVMEQKAVKYYGPQADHAALAKAKAKHQALKERRAAELAAATAPALAGEVDILLAATTDKRAVDAAQDAWLLERIETTADKRHKHSPNNLPLAPAPAPAYEDEELDITTFPRQY